MAKRLNGNLGWVIALVVMGAGVVASFAVWGRDVGEMRPEVHLNTEHRLTDNVDTVYIKAKIENIEKVQTQILNEVRK